MLAFSLFLKPGFSYQHLTLIQEIEPRGGRRVRCRCKCGNVWEGFLDNWRRGRTVSCGCVHKATITKHGQYKTPEYKRWLSIRQRCNNPHSPEYKNYGGRGIKVCRRWNSFENFLADMGTAPFPNAEIERKNNNRNYSPSNCRWATHTENNRNTRKSKVWIIDGVEYESMRHAAQLLGVSRWTIDRWCNGGRKGCSSRKKYAA